MKKGILLVLSFALCLMLITACGKGSGKSAKGQEGATKAESGSDSSVDSGSDQALQDVNEIPSNGIITKDQFASVMGEDKDITFTGTTDDGISYTWTYHCAQIQNPEDQNLKIDFDLSELSDVKQRANNANDALKMTMHGKGVICSPDLDVVIPLAWQSDTGLLLKEQNDALVKMSDVTISSVLEEESADQPVTTEPGKGTTSFHMTILSLDGDSYIVGGITDPDKLAALNKQDSSDSETSTDSTSSGQSASSGSDSAGNDDSDTGSDSGSSGSKKSSSDSSSGSSSGKSKSTDKGKKKSSSSSSSSSSSGDSSSSSKDNTCTISINCSTILDHKKSLKKGKEEFVPSDGWILEPTTVTFSSGESVHDILSRVCRDKGIHMESNFSAAYDSAYVEGINQIYEKDCGELSGWMFNVNGWFPNYGCSKYYVSDGDTINWVYTCDLGKDVGDNSQY
jgi:hypothetical protein